MWLIIIIAVVLIYIALSVLGGVGKGVYNVLDPQTTDASAGPLIARSAQKAIDRAFPAGNIRVIEFLPKEKSVPTTVTSEEDIERIAKVLDKGKWEITALDKYQKTYWDGSLKLDILDRIETISLRAIIYTNEEGRGGFATICPDSLDYKFIRKILSGNGVHKVLSRADLDKQMREMSGIWKLTGTIERNGTERIPPTRDIFITYLQISPNDKLWRYNFIGNYVGDNRWVVSEKGYILSNGNEFKLIDNCLYEKECETGKTHIYERVERLPTRKDYR